MYQEGGRSIRCENQGLLHPGRNQPDNLGKVGKEWLEREWGKDKSPC
jgi:hypothetical protein